MNIFCPLERSQLNKLIWQWNSEHPKYVLLLFQATVSASCGASNFSRLTVSALVSIRHDSKHLSCRIPMLSSHEWTLLLFQEITSVLHGASNIFSRLIVSTRRDSKHSACQIPMLSCCGPWLSRDHYLQAGDENTKPLNGYMTGLGEYNSQ